MRTSIRDGSGPLPRNSAGVFCTSEGTEVVVEVQSENPVNARISGTRLQPISIEASQEGLKTRWAIPIHTWAGHAELEISDGRNVIVEMLDVQPHPGKLGLNAFREMLDEISRVCRDLPWGLSPGALPGKRLTGSPPVVHPAVLEHELPVLQAALTQLRYDPLTATIRSREVRRLRNTRSVDASSLRWLAAHPRSLVSAVSPTSIGATDDAVFLEQRHTETSFAHPATEYVNFLLKRLSRVLATNANYLDSLAKSANPEDHDHAVWLSQRVKRAGSLVTTELRRVPLCLVAPRPPTEGAAQIVLDNPVYARVQRAVQRLLDPGVTISIDGLLSASIRRTHELYELLVLYRLVTAFRQKLGPAWRWKLPDVVRMSAIDALPTDAAFVATNSTGGRIEIRYQSTFISYRRDGRQGGQHALSGERRPDLIVGLFQDDRLTRWLILDAKYRKSRSAIHDGLADLHVYRDALRWYGQSCIASFIAIPACDPSAEIYTTEGYIAEHHFGAVVTSAPACWNTALNLLG